MKSDKLTESLISKLSESVDWNYFNKFDDVTDKYMPDSGEGDTLASQIVTAVNKLVYKWYNDGDVFDNVNSHMEGWANDLSSYANWLYRYCKPVSNILRGVYDCSTDSDYENLLQALADKCLDEDFLTTMEQPKQGSIYECDGPFEFNEYNEEDDEEDWIDTDYDEDLEESKKLIESEFTLYNPDTDESVRVWKDYETGKWIDSDGNRYMGYLTKDDIKQYFRGNWLEDSKKICEVRVNRVLEKGDQFQNKNGVIVTIIDVDKEHLLDGEPQVTYRFENTGDTKCYKMSSVNGMLSEVGYEKID